MEVLKLCAAFLFIIFTLHGVLSRKHHRDISSRRVADKYREFFCRKAKTCPHSSEKVCGWDEQQPFLAVFGDVCTMYRANCRGVGMFFVVNMIVCDTKLNYEKEHVNETFEFIHLRPTVTEPQMVRVRTKPTAKAGLILRMQRMKLAADKFAASYCKKGKYCIRGGEVVCAFDKEKNITAVFPDKCIYYAVNCFKQGRYKLIDLNFCRPNITYSAERLTEINGDPFPLFMTYLPSRITKMAYGEQPGFSLVQPTRPIAASSRKRKKNSEN